MKPAWRQTRNRSLSALIKMTLRILLNRVKTDTLLRNLNGIKEEYKENDVIEVSTFEDYRNYINYVRRWVLVEVKEVVKETKKTTKPTKTTSK